MAVISYFMFLFSAAFLVVSEYLVPPLGAL